MAGRDLLNKLADAGEEAIGKLSEAPGADRLMGVLNNMRDRMDEMQRKLRGIDALETRVAELERRLSAMEGKPESLPPPSSATTGVESTG